MSKPRSLIVALGLAALLPGFQGAPQDEYKTKLAALSKSTAAKHYSIADYLAGASMHIWSREQLYKTIEFDPDHEGARKKLGFKKNDEGAWESDPNAKQEFGNKKKGEDAERVRKQYVDRLDSAGRDLSRQWGDLALFCKKNSMAAESAAAFMKALEYDPANATARKELGYEKDAKGVWMSKTERELRKQMKDGIPKAPTGAAASGETDTEKGMSLKMKKRESEHFFVEAPHLKEEQLGGLLQHAEHAYAMFHKVFVQEDLFGGRKLGFVALKDKAQHTAYVNAFYKADAAHMKLALDARATGGWPRCEIYQETAPDSLLQDWVIHSSVEALLRFWCGERYCWILEGMALHFTRLMKDSAQLHCVDLAGTSPQNKGKNYSDPADWPVICRVWVRENKDPDLTSILKRTNFGEFDGADAVKSWSMVEFLLAQHREKFIEFLTTLHDLHEPKEGKAVVEGGIVEAALKKVWGWTINDLDYRWKQYVKVAY
jgi:hypothetical protein